MLDFKFLNFNILPKNFIFDMGEVLLKVNKNLINLEIKKHGINLYDILKHPSWQNLEKNIIDRETAYAEISKATNYSVKNIDLIIKKARDTLEPVENMIALMKALKSKGKRVYCFSNTPKEEITILRQRFEFFNEFEVIFASGDIKMRKPEINAYRYVLAFCNLVPEETVFIDDSEMNVRAANTIGMSGILFNLESPNCVEQCIEKIKNICKHNKENISQDNFFAEQTRLLNNKMILAYKYMTDANNVGKYGLYESMIGVGKQLKNAKISAPEIFASSLILSLNKQVTLSKTGDNILRFLSCKHKNGLFYFFADEPNPYPQDADTTSMALSLLYERGIVDIALLKQVVNVILDYLNEDKLILTYFNKDRVRLDAIVCANTLYFINLAGRGDEPVLMHTENYLFNYLNDKKYENGTLFYLSSDIFLYSIARLVYQFPRRFKMFKEVLIREIRGRIATTNDALDLACRIIICNLMNISNNEDYDKLLLLQLEDGSWAPSAIYKATAKKGALGEDAHFSSKALTTGFAMKAMESQITNILSKT